MAGQAIGGGMSTIMGYGDYKVGDNTLLSGNVPEFVGNHHSVRIKHREFLTDINTPGPNFNIRSFKINPVDSLTFPWLSRIAGNYAMYKLHGMIFEFSSRSSNALNSTNTALGSLIMATRYNAQAPRFVNKIAMEASEYTTATNPSVTAIHPIECAPQLSVLDKLYIRATNSSEDPQQFYDFGVFYIATVGQQAASNIGELWVSYDIELIKPQLPVEGRMATYSEFYTTDEANTSFKLGRGTDQHLNGATALVVNPITAQPALRVNKVDFPNYVYITMYAKSNNVAALYVDGLSISDFVTINPVGVPGVTVTRVPNVSSVGDNPNDNYTMTAIGRITADYSDIYANTILGSGGAGTTALVSISVLNLTDPPQWGALSSLDLTLTTASGVHEEEEKFVHI